MKFIPIALMASAAMLLLTPGCNTDEVVVVPPASAAYSLSDFTSSSACEACHPRYVEEWKGSMHRYSTADPIWMLANNSLQQSTGGTLGKTCFQCHAPLGFLTDNTKPTFQFSDLDPLVREGITCDFCHVLRPPYLSTNQSIQYTLDPGPVKYGTLTDPVPTSAHEHGYDPDYDRSDVCRQCHDLTVNGVPVEVTFTEWQNSAWGGMSVECQHCHMRKYTGRATPTGPVRNDLHRHSFVGVDVAITGFPGKVEQRAEADSLLKNSASMELIPPTGGGVGETLNVGVNITNDKTGHNLPTSVFFNRQMWIEVTVWKGSDTVYRSGHLDANGDLMDKNSALRPDEDTDLVIFNGTLYKDGRESNVFELDSLVNKSLAPFESRTSQYGFTPGSAGAWNIRARLLFRPFGPYLFRSLNAGQYVSELPIFEMLSREATVTIY
ncbi:MAG TPA: multiheme c-type cytochrome [Bacteroidota bacterium]|nr:multiheme c-type cytochrome [Bacteroidota bacterium]